MKKRILNYPSNDEVNRFIDCCTDHKLNSTMPDVAKAAAMKIAGYLDFITGYWMDYETHVVETQLTAEDIRGFCQDHPTLPGKTWDYWPEVIKNKVLKHAQREHKQRVRTIREMGAFLQRQQETMAKFTPEAAAAMEKIQDGLAA